MNERNKKLKKLYLRAYSDDLRKIVKVEVDNFMGKYTQKIYFVVILMYIKV